MSRIFHRNSHVSCFFCQENVTPVNPKSFLCPHCQCWNRYDANGDIMSDDPAMHEESLNANSFARRASPRRDRFLSSFNGVKLCETCRSNQSLVMSLLSSYLPPSEADPEYQHRLETYDEYKRTLEARYPPVCAACAVLVQEEIQRKNAIARTNVLGRGLLNSKQTDRKRQVSASFEDRVHLSRNLLWWKTRGVLFWCTLVLAIAVDWAGLASRLPSSRPFYKHLYVVFLGISPLWMAWDPTYAHMRRARLQGRRVEVQGRRVYIWLQSFIWLNRLGISILLLLRDYKPSWNVVDSQSELGRSIFLAAICAEITVCITSYVVLRLYEAPHVRLLYENTDRSRSTTPAPPSASASQTRFMTPAFSNTHATRPPRRTASPQLQPLDSSFVAPSGSSVFGRPSLLPSNWPAIASRNSGHRPVEEDTPMRIDGDEDAMDWTPTVSEAQTRRKDEPWSRPTQSGLRREDTGLEDLLAETKLLEEPSHFGGAFRAPSQSDGWSWWWVYGLLFIPLSAIYYTVWLSASQRAPNEPLGL